VYTYIYNIKIFCTQSVVAVVVVMIICHKHSSGGSRVYRTRKWNNFNQRCYIC